MSREEIIKFSREVMKVATGEPDKNYDAEIYDKILKKLDNAGFAAYHKEFDKYQGIYIHVDGVDTFWTVEYYVTGKESPSTGDREYSEAYLEDDNGRYSANPGDYFMMSEDDVFEDTTLVIKDRNGEYQQIDNPKKSDLPRSESVRNTIEYEGEPNEVLVLSPESAPDVRLEVVISPKGRVNASELIDYCKSNVTVKQSMKKKAQIDFDQMRQEIAKLFGVDIAEVEINEDGQWGHLGDAGGFTVEGVEFNWIANEECANRIAVDYVAEDLQSEPSLFNIDFLIYYLYIGDVDKRIMIAEEEDRVESDFDDWSEEEKANYMEMFKDGLENPYQYFVEDEGMYSPEDFFDANFVQIDVTRAANDIVDTDGWPHLLSLYDGNYETLPCDIVIFGENNPLP